MTAHEYVDCSPTRDLTKGRYVAFDVPMKYIARPHYYPDQVPIGYLQTVECKDLRAPIMSCSTNAEFEDDITVRLHIDKSQICHAEEIVDAHLNYLRKVVVEER